MMDDLHEQKTPKSFVGQIVLIVKLNFARFHFLGIFIYSLCFMEHALIMLKFEKPMIIFVIIDIGFGLLIELTRLALRQSTF